MTSDIIRLKIVNFCQPMKLFPTSTLISPNFSQETKRTIELACFWCPIVGDLLFCHFESSVCGRTLGQLSSQQCSLNCSNFIANSSHQRVWTSLRLLFLYCIYFLYVVQFILGKVCLVIDQCVL